MHDLFIYFYLYISDNFNVPEYNNVMAHHLFICYTSNLHLVQSRNVLLFWIRIVMTIRFTNKFI